jgi:hypothetical protein
MAIGRREGGKMGTLPMRPDTIVSIALISRGGGQEEKGEAGERGGE